MQQPSSVGKLSSPSVQSAALTTLNADYLQEALDSLFVPSSLAVNDFHDAYQSRSRWPVADPSLHLLPAAVVSPAAVDLDTPPAGPTRVLSSTVGESQPTDTPKKKLSREYQRKFRMRSKVCNQLRAHGKANANELAELNLHLHFRQRRKPSRQSLPPLKQSFRNSKLSITS